MKDWANRLTTYTYYDDGRLKETLRQNNTKQLREYDAAGRLEHLKEYASGGTTILYSGDYRYDAANQLIGETINPAVAPTFFTHSQTFDADNRLLTHNGESVTIDADGNLTGIAAGVAPASYGYDVRNRLTSAGTLTYTYDAQNRRVAQTDASGTTTYVINPNAALDQVLMKAVDGVTTFYVYGLGLLHEETGGVVRYYHFDRRGDTVALTNSSGTVTGSSAYGVFGELSSQTGTLDTPFLFNGRWGVQTDSNGLYYHRARYYHPALRRFLNQDVMLGSITNGASMNRFAYANGNPVTLIDPFGLMPQDATPMSIEAQLEQARVILERNLRGFAPGGPYAEYASLISTSDIAGLGGAISSLGFGLRAQQMAMEAARDGMVLDAGLQAKYYSGVTVGQAELRAFAGDVIGVAGVGLDGYALGTAIVEQDGAAASLSVGNLTANFGAAALGGPPGLAISGGQLVINATLITYSGIENRRDKVRTEESARAALQTIQAAKKTINRLSQ